MHQTNRHALFHAEKIKKFKARAEGTVSLGLRQRNFFFLRLIF